MCKRVPKNTITQKTPRSLQNKPRETQIYIWLAACKLSCGALSYWLCADKNLWIIVITIWCPFPSTNNENKCVASARSLVLCKRVLTLQVFQASDTVTVSYENETRTSPPFEILPLYIMCLASFLLEQVELHQKIQCLCFTENNWNGLKFQVSSKILWWWAMVWQCASKLAVQWWQ